MHGRVVKGRQHEPDTSRYLVCVIFGGVDFAHGNGSPLEAYLVLLAATPLSGRWMLWVTAPDATVPVTEPGASIATAAAPAHPR